MAGRSRTPPSAGDVAHYLRQQERRRLEAQYGVAGAFNQTRPIQDPQLQTAASRQSLNEGGSLLLGRITDCTMLGHVYRVQLERLQAPVVATMLGAAGSLPGGAVSLTTLQPGTEVLCYYQSGLPFALIIGPVPLTATESRRQRHSVISGASRSRVDDAHKLPLRMPSAGYISSLTSGRPFDSTSSGEWGAITDTGLRVFLDSFMAQFGLDESTGITAFLHDALLRVSGYNLQVWSAASERESFDDQGETSDWTGYAQYPWEQMGVHSQAALSSRLTTRSPLAWQQTEPHYSKVEPSDDHAMPWHREREFHGFLGQGFSRILQAPAPNAAAESYGEGGPKHPGLIHEFWTLDGRYCLSAVKGITLAKRGVVVSPRRQQRPEQPNTGDGPGNYRASGLSGDGPEHRITGDLQTQSDKPQLSQAAGVLDLHAYLFNYAGLAPFAAHTKDYAVYEESDASWAGGQSGTTPNYLSLAESMYIDPGPYTKLLHIDHRYGEQKFNTLLSHVSLLDDGGIVIGDGFGASLTMTGGSIILAAPGDVWVKSGRNHIVWSGADTIVRARKDIDITSSDGDLRLKAEQHLQALAGNGGTGAMLLESRGSGFVSTFDDPDTAVGQGGILLRAPRAGVVAWSQDIYLRTGGGSGESAVGEGDIILDAGAGDRNVVIHCRDAQTYHSAGGGATYHHFLGGDGNVERSNKLSQYRSTLCGDRIDLNGTTVITDGLFMQGSIMVAGGHILTEQADGNPYVSPLGNAVSQVTDVIADTEKQAEADMPEVGTAGYASVLQAGLYDPGRPGNDEVISRFEVGLRGVDGYHTRDFTIFEDHWQQRARLAGQEGQQWTEPSVRCYNRETLPYPGLEKFSEPVLVQQPLTMFDPATGAAKPRTDAAYAEPKFGQPTPVPLTQYTVIR